MVCQLLGGTSAITGDAHTGLFVVSGPSMRLASVARHSADDHVTSFYPDANATLVGIGLCIVSENTDCCR